MTSSQPIDFALINAFSRAPFGGNPAAVVFLDAPRTEAELMQLTRVFNQPVAAFIFPPTGKPYPTGSEEGEDASAVATFGLRWFSPLIEVPLCGHGTVAAASALFARPGLVAETVRELRFEIKHGFFAARRAPEGRIEIELPAFDVALVSDAEFARVKKAVCTAFGREEVAVKYIGKASSGDASKDYVLIEVDEKEDLGGTVVDAAAFVSTLPPLSNHLPTPHALS